MGCGINCYITQACKMAKTRRIRACLARLSPKLIILCSKPVILTIVWVLLCSAIYYSMTQVWPNLIRRTQHSSGSFWTTVTAYAIITVAFIFYPLSGMLGDVCFGRIKAVVSGIVLVILSMLTTSAAAVVLLVDDLNDSSTIRGYVIALAAVSVLLFLLGMSIFSSNVLQFGLDQLMEKPSESFGVFAHWLVWALKFGPVLIATIYAPSNCLPNAGKIVSHLTYITPVCLLILLLISLIFGYCTRRHFNRDRVKYNPYKMIYRVLNFARKHKYPVGPVSAFAYSYEYQPSRLDYAKERYGGPFTTSDVEDVKTFTSVFFLLLAIGPVFALDLPLSSFFFKRYELHASPIFSLGTINKTCDSDLDIGALSRLVTMVLFPLYMWLIYSVFRNRSPLMLHRLVGAIFLEILALVSMLLIDMSGHLMLTSESQLKCMFVENVAKSYSLNFHWSVLLFPSLAKSFSYDVILATSFEFIAAQSPHTMQGVLLGSYFAMLGVFRALGAILLVPFALDSIWKYGSLGRHPPVISCGFGYYLVCISVALIGLICFMVAAKRYKYRRRDEEPFSQACVEEIFARRIANQSQHRHRAGYQELPGSNDWMTQ